MLRIFCTSVLLFSIPLAVEAQSNKALEMPIDIPSTNGLIPSIWFQKYDSGWSIHIDLTSQTNFPKNSWLKITNSVGSKLRLWTTNGVELISQNPDVSAAKMLPMQTTVQDVMKGVPRQWRINQWLPTHILNPGDAMTDTAFTLNNYFSFSKTNDLILQISPLIYRVETNLETAHLVEFPSLKLKLRATGEVEKVE